MTGDAPIARTGLALCHRVTLDSVAHWESNDLKNNNTWLTAAKKDPRMGKKEKQDSERVIED